MTLYKKVELYLYIRIVGEGTHDYLYKNNDYYKNYYSNS